MRIISKNIIKLRHKMNLTQKNLSENSGVDTATIGRIEKGEDCRINTLIKIADSFCVPLEMLLCTS